MRKLTFALLLLFGLSACNEDAAAPETFDPNAFAEATDLAFDASFAGDPMARSIPLIMRLPDHLRLTSDQEATIKDLLHQFVATTRTDREALAAIMKEARDARLAGKSLEEIRAILQQGEPIRQRLVTAQEKLRTDLFAVLSADQKAWIESWQPPRCEVQLTDAQKNEIAALNAAFQENNRADLETVRAALEAARAAHRAGASRSEIDAILQSARPAMLRIHTAQMRLFADIAGMLTPEQLASPCHIWRFGHR
jgi:Spy/CpxP family protein refolding chaperone